MDYMNSPLLWVCAIAVFLVIALQSLIYIRAVSRAGPELGVTREELRASFRSGAVAAIGPSLAVVVVAVALLALFGTPAVLVRIGLVGSAATETASAQLAAGTMNAELGGDTWNAEVFTVAFFAMSFSGIMWMIATLILTPILKRGDAKLRRVNPVLMSIVPSAALLGAFSSLAVAEIPKSGLHILIVGVSALVMALCLYLAHLLKTHWLREWALGFAIITGLVVAYFAVQTPLAP